MDERRRGAVSVDLKVDGYVTGGGDGDVTCQGDGIVMREGDGDVSRGARGA